MRHTIQVSAVFAEAQYMGIIKNYRERKNIIYSQGIFLDYRQGFAITFGNSVVLLYRSMFNTGKYIGIW